jgi:hypothetical protein
MQDELTSFTAPIDRGQRVLDAELIRLCQLAFGDALRLGGMPWIELPTPLAQLLLPDLSGLDQRHGKKSL